MLTLPIKKKWFDMIKSGEKKEEYREIKPYYDSRFGFIDDPNLKVKTYQVTRTIRFKNGYSKQAPMIECHVNITKGQGREEWGAEKGKRYYVLKILSVEEI